jgi:replication factor A2
VRVWGRLHSLGNKRYVGAHIIRPITDFNEINYHLLEATVVHLHFTRGPPLGPKGVNEQRDVHMNNTGYGGDSLPVGLSATAIKVYRCLETTPQSNEGLHQQDIASRLGMDVNEVVRGGDQLMEFGLIYSTVDECTWAILNMG